VVELSLGETIVIAISSVLLQYLYRARTKAKLVQAASTPHTSPSRFCIASGATMLGFWIGCLLNSRFGWQRPRSPDFWQYDPHRDRLP